MLILPFKAIHSELLKTSLKNNKSILILIPPHFKEEALDRTMWRARFGRGFGPVVRQTTKWNDSTLNSNYWKASLFIVTPCVL